MTESKQYEEVENSGELEGSAAERQEDSVRDKRQLVGLIFGPPQTQQLKNYTHTRAHTHTNAQIVGYIAA